MINSLGSFRFGATRTNLCVVCGLPDDDVLLLLAYQAYNNNVVLFFWFILYGIIWTSIITYTYAFNKL